MINTAQLRPGNSAVIIGTGGVGLNAVQGAALAGATPIIAVDLLDHKLTAAITFGATHTIHAGRDDVQARVRDLTGGRGADYVFVTVGSTTAVEQALTLTRRGGTVVLVGLPRTGASVPLVIWTVIGGEQRIVGSALGSTRLSVDVPRLVQLYQQKRLKLDELITARYPLDRINAAIEAVERGEALRNVIVFGAA